MAVTSTAIPQQLIVARNARKVYEPSVFGGTGVEVRRNLVLAVDQTVRDELTALEESLDLGPDRSSVVKPETIRVKIDTDTIRVFDAEHQQINLPAKWIHPSVDARLEIKGIWKTASKCGLSVSCTDLRFCTDAQSSPFK